MYNGKKYRAKCSFFPTMPKIKTYTIVAFLVTFMSYSNSAVDLCNEDAVLADFPEEVVNNLYHIIARVTIMPPTCPKKKIKTKLINMWVWNQEHLSTPIMPAKRELKRVLRSKPTIILIPGWLCNINDRMPDLIKAYLLKYDCNVIGVDWSAYAMDTYEKAYCSAQLVAKYIAGYICYHDLNADNIHIVGHSIGAHIAGLVGKEVQAKCHNGNISRITGLDPAGPIYQSVPAEYRLVATDANSVDVIHTNQGVFGFSGVCGTTDFFPNCGTTQPGCSDLTDIDASTLANLRLSDVTCHHLRSADYMIESINSNSFVAKSSITFPIACVQSLIFSSTAIMGETCPAVTPANKYLLWTNGQPPYARG